MRILVCFLALLVLLCGCGNDNSKKSQGPEKMLTDVKTGYTDFSDIITTEIIGKDISLLQANQNNAYLKSENVYGYSYVSFLGVKGKLLVYSKENIITSVVFTSDSYSSQAEYKHCFDTLNSGISKMLGVSCKETDVNKKNQAVKYKKGNRNIMIHGFETNEKSIIKIKIS